MYDDTYEENKIMTISLTNNVKQKIRNEFDDDIEEFIEREFPQDKELNIYMFKHGKGDKETLALKVENSDYMLLIKRSEDSRSKSKDNYMFCFAIEDRAGFIKDKDNEFIEKKCELKIPMEFNKRYYNNSTKELLDDIEEEFEYIEPYKTPSLGENDEFKKWYSYLTLLEKLIDAKDFYFEASIRYTDKKAKVDISDIKNNELLDKIKKSRNQSFLYYKTDEVDTTKELHEWDEKNSKNKNFGELKENKNKELTFKLDEEFIKNFEGKNNHDDEIISNNYDTNDFVIKSRQYIEKSIKTLNKNIVNQGKFKNKINVANSIKNLDISKEEENSLIEIWSKLSEEIHNENEDEINRVNVNKALQILEKLLPNKNDGSFSPPAKLLLRVSYFRDSFQLKTLKWGLDKIQSHSLRPYLFGDKKIDKIDDDDLDNLEIKYLSKVLNDKQKEAINKAILSKDIFMIQGPPGTGKTEVISELAYQEAIRGNKVLITSQANMAVDNAIQRLNHPSLYPVRIIRKDYEPEDGDNLPIEANIDSFYQSRIIKNIKKELTEQENELSTINSFIDSGIIDDSLIDVIGKLDISVPSNIDLKNHNDKEDFIRILKNKNNLSILITRLDELNELAHFIDLRQNYLNDLENEEDYDIEEEKNYLSSNYKNNTNIWGATLFETGKFSFNDKRFDVVIVDEVSKATPPELILPILKAKKLILVGDHKQLPPIIKDVSLEDLAKETGISVDSLDFEKTVFEKLIENNPDSYVMLNKQYRMHPHIQMAINQFYIDDKNKDGLECGLLNPDIEKCHGLQDEIFKKKHLVWLKTKNSDKEEKIQGSTSFFNTAEVDKIATTLKILNQQYIAEKIKPSVGVITFYGKQLRELNELEKDKFWNLPYDKRNYSNLDLRFGTVDRFQGQEKDIIIVSLVRNNSQHNVGFAKKPHRINVAFSRARKLLIIVGNVDNFTFGQDEKSSKQYRNIFNIAKKFGSVGGI